jgi:two-component system response regulator RegA
MYQARSNAQGAGAAETMSTGTRPTLLLVDDDEAFAWTIRRAFESRGYDVAISRDFLGALNLAHSESPEYAVVDLRIQGGSGLELVSRLKEASPETRIVVLTGYASIATAVAAIKLGASDYLTKPADIEALEAAMTNRNVSAILPATERLMSVDRLEWEYIQRALTTFEGNISATARALGMHRRTLQRKLQKRPVRA